MRFVFARGARALLVSLLAAFASAQVQLEWTAVYDGPGSPPELASRCAVDAQGNVYFAGWSDVAANRVLLASYSAGGVLRWTQYEDVAANPFQEIVQDLALGPNGDIYVCGYLFDSSSGIAVYDAFVIAYSSNGVAQWTRVYDGPAHGYDIASALAVDGAGNLLVCGTSKTDPLRLRDLLVLSYTPNGVLNWESRIDLGFGGFEYGWAIRALPNGDIVVAGTGQTASSTSGHYDGLVAKLDANGVLRWTSTFDVGSQEREDFRVLSETGSNRIVAVGTLMSTELTLVAEFDPGTGAILWTQQSYGSIGGGGAVTDATGVTWVTGSSNFARFSASGAQLSQTTYPDVSPATGLSAGGIFLGTAGQVWILGVAHSPIVHDLDVFVAQYDSSGAFNWWRIYAPSGTLDDAPYDAALAPNDRLVLAGSRGPWPYDAQAVQFDLSDSAQAYCTAKTTSTGCVPATSFTGMPSASASSGFVVRCAQVRNQKNGLLFYGVNGSASLPFQGGTMCVAVPQVRTPIQVSGGNASPADDCSGVFALDMNAYATGSLGGAPLPALQVVGTTVHCQFWGRDPGFAPPQNSMLSNALRYVVLP